MSYLSQARLGDDDVFSQRVRACTIEQAEHFAHDDRSPIVALARSVAIGDAAVTVTFVRLLASAPGFADKAGEAPNQERVPDGDILAAVQSFWPIVADLYYTDDGARQGDQT
jgi:hypothetical protein